MYSSVITWHPAGGRLGDGILPVRREILRAAGFTF
jgi:hypothetical protein